MLNSDPTFWPVAWQARPDRTADDEQLTDAGRRYFASSRFHGDDDLGEKI